MNSTILTLTLMGLFGGTALWLGLLYRNRVNRISTRQLFITLLAVGLICRITFSILTPTFYAPDEQSHFNYVKYLAENHSLPVQTSRTGSPTNDWQYYHPPLYYLLLTPLYQLSETFFQDDIITVRLMRVASIFLWSITVFFSFKLLNILKINDVFLRIFVICIICLLPTYTFLSAVINNDNLVFALGSGILYLSVQRISFKSSALIGILLGLALLTKLTAVVYVVLITLILLIGLIKKTKDQTAILHFALVIGLALVIWAPWAWRSYSIYGSITAEEVANVPHQWKSLHYAAYSTLEYMQTSFWAVSGIKNNINFFYPTIGRYVFYFACIGLLYGLSFKRERLILLVKKNLNIMIAFTLAILINALLVFRFGLLYAQGQGRFLFPLLIPISLLMGIGLRMFSISEKEDSPINLTGFFIAYAISFMLFSLAMFTKV